MSGNQEPIFMKFMVGGISCAITSSLLNPVDVTKVRLQNQKNAGPSAQYKGFMDGLLSIFRNEGIRGLSRGVTASILRELSYSSVRIGAYEPIRNFLSKQLHVEDNHDAMKNAKGVNTAHPVIKWSSALLSGGLGSMFANPTDLVKTRFQAVIPPNEPPYGNSTLRAFVEIYKTEGIRNGLYRATGATVIRAALLTSAQLGTYDVFKNNICLHYLDLEDGLFVHFLTAMVTGVVTTTAANPADVIKTRFMADAGHKYTSMVDCIVKTFRAEGPMAFMKGWTAAYWRLGPHTVISFLIMEKMRNLLSMKSI